MLLAAAKKDHVDFLKMPLLSDDTAFPHLEKDHSHILRKNTERTH